MAKSIVRKRFAVALVAVTAVAGSTFVDGTDPRVVQPVVATPATVPPAVAVAPRPVAVEPAPVVEIPVEEVTKLVRIDAAERARLAQEMSRWQTRHPQQLVEVIADLAEQQTLPLPPTFSSPSPGPRPAGKCSRSPPPARQAWLRPRPRPICPKGWTARSS